MPHGAGDVPHEPRAVLAGQVPGGEGHQPSTEGHAAGDRDLGGAAGCPNDGDSADVVGFPGDGEVGLLHLEAVAVNGLRPGSSKAAVAHE